jgi:hypothetical protein
MSCNRQTIGTEDSDRVREESNPAERRRWAVFGLSAIDAGTPDRGLNDDEENGDLTDAIDTVANILHWLDHRGCKDPLQILPSAQRYFAAERKGDDR